MVHYKAVLAIALTTSFVNGAPLTKRIAQVISDSTVKWQAACLAAGGGQQCNPVAVAAFGTLLAAPGPCEQQDAADKMVDLAKTLNNDPNTIKFAQIFAQQPRNSPNSLSVPYCQKAPKNAELNGLFQCQFKGDNSNTFVGGVTSGSTGTIPFGMSSPVSPAGSCKANPSGPIQDGTQLTDITSDPGVGSGSGSPNTTSTKTKSSGASASMSTSAKHKNKGKNNATMTTSSDGSAPTVIGAAASLSGNCSTVKGTKASKSANASASATSGIINLNNPANSTSTATVTSGSKAANGSASPTSGIINLNNPANSTATPATVTSGSKSANGSASPTARIINLNNPANSTATATSGYKSANASASAKPAVINLNNPPNYGTNATSSSPATTITTPTILLPSSAGQTYKVAASGSSPSGGFQLQNGQKAQKLNAQFSKLTTSSSCTDGQQACVNQGFAQCVGGKFQVTQCAASTVCAALPLVNKPGTAITCTTTSDAQARIKATGAAGGLTGSGA